MNFIRKIVIIIFVFSANTACATVVFLDVLNTLDSADTRLPWANTETIISGDAYSGEKFGRADSLHPYSFGYKGKVPPNAFLKNLRIRFDAQVRVQGLDPKAQVIVSVQHGDSSVYWESFSLGTDEKIKSGKWFLTQNEFSIPRNLSDSGYVLAIYIWNESKTSIVDIDDFHLVMEEKVLPSFLLANVPPVSNSPASAFVNIFSGKYFKVEFDKFTGTLQINGSEGQPLIRRFLLSFDGKNSGNKIRESEIVYSTYFSFISDSLSEEGTSLNFLVKNSYAEVHLQFLFSSQHPDVKVHTTTIFLNPVLVNRIALIFDFVPGLTEVFLPSTHSDVAEFQHEYWLGHQGFIAGEGKNGFMIASAKNLSSIQLDADSQRCYLNLDYSLDHPMLHFPLMKTNKNFKEDFSQSVYSGGDTLRNDFVVNTRWDTNRFPRIMKNPDGKTAAMIWTEHADYTDLQTQRAVNFGADTIEHATQARGGFVANKIPVTKSVFFSNPENVSNADRTGFWKTSSASIQGTPGFREFLFELQNEGFEICLHTPEHYTTTRKRLQQALEETAKDFHPTTWIDHGYDNSPESNREDLACDGLNSKSKFYSMDLWQGHGLKYFWNSYYEDSYVYAPFIFYSFLSVPYSGWGNRFPMLDYWTHPTRSESLIHWSTANTLDPPDSKMWWYELSEKRLEDLIQSRETHIIHCYPSRLDSTNGFYIFENNHFRIDPEFEKVLQRQALMRNEGKLNITTIRQYLDFQLVIAQVECVPMNGNQVKLKNNSDSELKGISLSLKAANVNVSGKEIKTKRQGSDLVFWFDLKAKEEVLISW